MSEKETLFKLKSKPTKELEKIFINKEACGLWCIYRSYHIISKDGLEYLNETCFEIIKNGKKFTKIQAKHFLEKFSNKLSDIEHSKPSYDWIEKAIPFMVGEKKIAVEVVK